MCICNVKGRSNYKGHRNYRAVPSLPVMGVEMAIKRRDASVQEQGGPKKVPLTAWQKSYPTLWEFLSLTTFEDGSDRKLPTITLFLGPDGLQACLNDRDQGMAAFVTSVTLDGLWTALEEGLKGDKLDWRRSQQQYGKKTKK